MISSFQTATSNNTFQSRGTSAKRVDAASRHSHFLRSMNLLMGSIRSSSVFILSDGGTTASPSSRSSSSVLNHISSSSSRVRASRRKRWFLRMERMLRRETRVKLRSRPLMTIIPGRRAKHFICTRVKFTGRQPKRSAITHRAEIFTIASPLRHSGSQCLQLERRGKSENFLVRAAGAKRK